MTSGLLLSPQSWSKSLILKETEHELDPVQFAYRPNRGVEDATLTLLNMVFKHVESKGTFAWLLFVDFSSDFNTILNQKTFRSVQNQQKCGDLDFRLWDGSHRVRMNGVLSDPVLFSTGSVLLPLLFILYTNMCQSTYENIIIKYTDDSLIIGLLKEGETSHVPVIDDCIVCEESYLHLNTSKTKDMVFDFRKQQDRHSATLIKGHINTLGL